MKKIINFISVAFVMVLFLTTVVYATDINMNLEITSSNGTVNEVENNDYNYNTGSSSSQNAVEQSTTVSSVASVSEDTFGLSQILNILLIVVGVVLILLGIAVLIRLK